MYLLAITAILAFLGSLCLTPLLGIVARRFGALDRPDGQRKLHGRIVPLWGGVAVYLATCLGLLGAYLVSLTPGDDFNRLSILVVAVGGFICMVGAIDDRFRLRARVKLLLQIVAVLPVVLLGGHVDRLVTFGYPIELGWFGGPLTVLWLIGCINALNLLDGMDGLATTVSLSTAIMMAIIAMSMKNPHVVVITIVWAGAMAGFLPYNLPRASIFLGDSGSMVLGFMAGILGLQGSMKTSATLSIAAPAVVMTLPIFDSVLAVFRRKLTGRRFDVPDRQHIHHRLLDRGLSTWQTLCVIGSFCLLSGAGATAATICRNEALAWATALALIVCLIRLRLFGHHELELAKSAVASRLVTWGNAICSSNPSQSLPPAEHLAQLPLGDLWAMLVQEVIPWKVSHLELELLPQSGQPVQYRWTAHQAAPEAVTWSLHLTIPAANGARCEIRAHGDPLPGIAFSGLTGLSQVLDVFGTQMVNHSSLPDLFHPQTLPLPQWRKAA